MSKKFKAFFILYSAQFVFAACTWCDCPSVGVYEHRYNSISVKTWNTAGFIDKEITDADTINKNAFGLMILFKLDRKKIACNSAKFRSNIGSFGFTEAKACSCPENEYINVDPAVSVEILVTDMQTSAETDITNDFYAYENRGKQIVIDDLYDLYKGKEQWLDNVYLDLVHYKEIPNHSIFTINVYLESGVKLTNKTGLILFK